MDEIERRLIEAAETLRQMDCDPGPGTNWPALERVDVSSYGGIAEGGAGHCRRPLSQQLPLALPVAIALHRRIQPLQSLVTALGGNRAANPMALAR